MGTVGGEGEASEEVDEDGPSCGLWAGERGNGAKDGEVSRGWDGRRETHPSALTGKLM